MCGGSGGGSGGGGVGMHGHHAGMENGGAMLCITLIRNLCHVVTVPVVTVSISLLGTSLSTSLNHN